MAYYQGDYANAEKLFLSVIKQYPNAYLSYKGLGYVQLQQKSYEWAAKNLAHTFRLYPKQPVSDYLFVANHFINAQQYAYAQAILVQAKAAYPYSGDIQFLLAKALWLQNQSQDAYPLLVSATYYSPVSVSAVFDGLKGLNMEKVKEAFLNMGWGLYVQGYYKAALYRFNQYLALDKTNNNALRGKAFALVQLGEYAAAEPILQEVLQSEQKSPLNPVTMYYYTPQKQPVPVLLDTQTILGWVAYFKGEYAQAQNIFMTVLVQHPSRINARLGSAYALKALHNKQYQQQVAIIEQQAPGYGTVIPEYSAYALKKAQWVYGVAWEKLYSKQYENALEDFDQAMRLFPNKQKWLALDGKAWVAYYQGNDASALAQFKSIIQLYPEAYLSYKGLAYLQLKEKQYRAAYQNVQKMLSLNAMQPPGVYAYLIQQFLLGNQIVQADALLKKGLALYPQSGDLLFLEAQRLWNNGRKTEAYPLIVSASYYSPVFTSTYLEDLSDLQPSAVKMAYLNMGWGLYMQGYYVAALKRFNQYLSTLQTNQSLSLEDLNAQRGKAFTLIKLNKNKEAISMLTALMRNQNAAQLQPISTWFYVQSAGKSVPVYLDTQTMLGWAYYATGDHAQAEAAFQAVLAEHPGWVNPRLGLAYVMKDTEQPSRQQQELDHINQLVPGYGHIFEPAAAQAFSVTVQGTLGWYTTVSPKFNNQTGSVSFRYAPSEHFQGGAVYSYNNIYFKPEAASSPSENTSVNYFVDLFASPVEDVGYFGFANKGFYFIKSAYNDNGANAEFMPYFGLIYKTPDQLNTIEPGYAYENYRDLIDTRIDQGTLSLSTLMVPNWLFSATGYFINYYTNDIPHSLHYYSVVPSATYFINDKQSIGVNTLIGRRRQAYDVDLNAVYDLRDIQEAMLGLTYSYVVNPDFSWFTNLSGARFKAASTGQQYQAYYWTIGATL